MAKRQTKAAAKTRKTAAKKKRSAPSRAKAAPGRTKRAPAPGPSTAPPAPRAAPKPGPVRVRMYRQGLGDCFLVTLPKHDSSPFFLMIDCGVILGTPDAATKMTNVVADIIKQTNGHVDLLVVTHEHWDHVSGFNQASDLFASPHSGNAKNGLSVDAVWFAWTEDPADALANRLRKDRADRLQKLTRFVSAMAAQPAALAEGMRSSMA